MSSHESEIVRKLRLIEWLKAELVGSVGRVFYALAKSGEHSIAEALAAVVVNCFALGKRLGIDYAQLDEAIQARLEQTIRQETEVEKWYGDMSELRRHLRQKR
ncbi:MAG: MazG-like family protein [Negativicutes bacterium]|nr:MazG-like family protein [Negativicutes bacterium]